MTPGVCWGGQNVGFVRTVLSDCDSDDSEDSYTRNANAYMANWHSSVDSNARNADAYFAI